MANTTYGRQTTPNTRQLTPWELAQLQRAQAGNSMATQFAKDNNAAGLLGYDIALWLQNYLGKMGAVKPPGNTAPTYDGGDTINRMAMDYFTPQSGDIQNGTTPSQWDLMQARKKEEERLAQMPWLYGLVR